MAFDSQLIKHVPFGIDTSKLDNHQVKKPSVLRIGYIGTFFEHKGVDLLLKAFLELPDQVGCGAQLKLYGDTNQFPQYVDTLKSLSAQGWSCRQAFNVSFPRYFSK
jgi:glycosyltransferase involved in cell wall biosynthesis